MSGLLPFMVFKVALVSGALTFAFRELWLLRRGDDNPELTRRMLRVLGGAQGRALNPLGSPPKPPGQPLPFPKRAEPEPAEQEPLRRAA